MSDQPHKPAARHIIRIPSGHCPFPLKEQWEMGHLPTDPIIIHWFHLVREMGLNRDTYYTAEAIAYWGKMEYDDELDQQHIEDIIYSYARSIGDYLVPPDEEHDNGQQSGAKVE